MEGYPLSNTLSRQERLRGKTNISTLMNRGKWGSVPGMKYCYFFPEETDCPRIIVSVPKKIFKRAVKRNLLKRRIREAYRTQKFILEGKCPDILFLYNEVEVLPFPEIHSKVRDILCKVKSGK